MATTIGPDFLSLRVRDLATSAEFYCDLLGVARSVMSPPGVVVLDSKPIQFALRAMDGADMGPVGEGVTVWLACNAVDDLFERVVDSGATVLDPPVDGPFGRMFTIADPDGYRLTLHQTR